MQPALFPNDPTPVNKIKAPQAIVHIRHSISTRQYKYWLILLREFRLNYELGLPPDDDGFFRISRAKIAELMGYEVQKDELRADFGTLRKEEITLNLLEKDGTPVIHGMGFLSEWKLSNKLIAYKLPTFLEKVMRGLDEEAAIFQRINWDILNSFSGKYEFIIYKLCRDYVGVGRVPYMSVEEVREYFGVKPDEYPVFKDFNRWCITKPVAAINSSETSDVEVTVEYKKNGTKTLGVSFFVKHKKQMSIPFPELAATHVFKFAKVSIDPVTQGIYLSTRTPNEIELCIDRVNEYAEGLMAQGKPVNYGALYTKAINEGWHLQHAQKLEQRALLLEERAQVSDLVTASSKEAEKKASQTRKDTDQWLANFESMADELKDALRQKYRAGLTLAALVKSFDKSGERSPMHRVAFATFVKSESEI